MVAHFFSGDEFQKLIGLMLSESVHRVGTVALQNALSDGFSFFFEQVGVIGQLTGFGLLSFKG